MDIKDKYYDKIRTGNMRLTKSRKAMIEILENHHLTFKEIQRELKMRGFNNISTIYNNLDFLIDQKIVVELFLNGNRYYDLAMENPNHDADSHTHVIVKDDNEIIEVNSPSIYEFIKKSREFSGLELESIRISITAHRQQEKES